MSLDREARDEVHAAWVRWLDGEGRNTSDPTTLRPVPEHRSYLENRLHAAFRLGVDVGAKAARDQVARKVAALLIS